MKAAVIDRFGGPEEIYYTDIEKPVPGPDEVLELCIHLFLLLVLFFNLSLVFLQLVLLSVVDEDRKSVV